MSVSRRTFVKSLGAGTAGALTSAFIGARGREAWAYSFWDGNPEAPTFSPLDTGDIIISSNENPLGPGQHVIDAMRATLGPTGAGAGRYYFARINEPREAIADKFGVEVDNVLMGSGSGEILQLVTEVFTSKDRPVVSPNPTFGTCARYAELLGRPVKRIPLDGKHRIDLDAMLDASGGAGLVFFCNPNNPTATLHSGRDTREFIDRINRRAPEAIILIDEAYHDYVTDPEHQNPIPLALENPRVVLARTFSKAYGMAGLRIGFAVGHKDTIKKMSDWRGMDMTSNVLARIGVVTSLEHNDGNPAAERARNHEVRRFTRKFFHDAGFEDTDSQTNFIFVNIRRSAEEFQKTCRERGVRISRGRDKFANYARISMGTMEEMKRATEVFAQVLGIRS
jgi:histidinol-phosphate aminotransferase